MLKDLDLSKNVKKDAFKEQFDALAIDLGVLQRKIKEAGIPVIISFDGWEAAGKGTQMNRIIQTLDPRSYNVYMGRARSDEERLRPYWWRFWTRTPAKGRIALFDKSWCYDAIDLLYCKEPDRDRFERTCNDINAFERQISDSGTVIIKLFLHISKKEQKKRLSGLEESKESSWRVSDVDREQNKSYKLWLSAAQETIDRTNTEHACWNLIEADDHRFATIKIFTIVAQALETALAKKAQASDENISAVAGQTSGDSTASVRTISGEIRTSVLDKTDLSLKLDPKNYSKELDEWQSTIRDLGYELYAKRKAMIVMYEGWDAAGKGGNIRRLTSTLDPRGYDVIPTAAPNDIERQHHYLWRFWNAIPKAGHIAIFDRTWYGRVMVERIEGFCTEEEWKRAYREINEIEAQLAGAGVGIVKFWLHIDKDEQLRRFKERQEIPWKNWKITDEDWRNRDKWDKYYEAVDEMLFRTSTSHAPWTVIEANDKYYARIKALKTVCSTMKTLLD